MIRMAEGKQKGRHDEDTIDQEWYAGAVTANTTNKINNIVLCVYLVLRVFH